MKQGKDTVQIILLIRVILFLLLPINVIYSQTTYYVSSLNGNDSNPGTSENKPWKSIAQVNKITLSPGDKVLFKRGERWEEGISLKIKNSGSQNGRIYIGSYGSGNKPILSLKSEVEGWKMPENWTQYSPNVWFIHFPNFAAQFLFIRRLWLDGIEYPRAKDLSGSNMDHLSPGEAETFGVNSKHRYMHNGISSPSRLYVWTDGRNPAVYYSSIKYVGKYTASDFIRHVVELNNCNYVTVDGLMVLGGLYSPIALDRCSNIIVTNCNIGQSQQGGVGNFYQISGFSNNVEISYCTIDSERKVKENFFDGTSSYAVLAGHGASNWLIHNNFIKNFRYGFLTASNYGVSLNHKFFNNDVTGFDIEYSKPVQLGSDGDSYDNGNHEIYNNFFHDITVGCQVSGGNPPVKIKPTFNNKFYFNIFKNFTRSENDHTTQSNSGFGITIGSEELAKDIFIFNNTFYNLNHFGIFAWGNNISAYNNLLIHTGLTRSKYQTMIGEYHSKPFNNNLFFNAELDLSDKIIEQLYDKYYTIEELNNKTFADGNLQYVGNLSNLINLSDFTLPAGSIALNAGADISGLISAEFKDRNGNLIDKKKPDIGAVGSSSVNTELNIKIFLLGAYNSSGMNNTLNINGLLPLSQPYYLNPWNYNGPEAVQNISPEVVDWILVELRRNTSPSSAAARRAAFLKSNGTIVDLDGSSPLNFKGLTPDNYYIVIKHRNHLAVMSKNSVQMDGLTHYDFTSGSEQFYGTGGAVEIKRGVWGMWGGDVNGDGGVFAEDYNSYRVNQGKLGYGKIPDFNLDGGVFAEDYTIYKLNQGKITSVP